MSQSLTFSLVRALGDKEFRVSQSGGKGTNG